MNYFMNSLHGVLRFLKQCVFGLIIGNDSTIASWLRRKTYKTVCMIDTNVFIRNLNNFRAGERSALYHSCYILNDFGMFRIGSNSHLGAFCYVNVCYGDVEIGNDVAIGPGTRIIAYSNHYEKGKKVTDLRITEGICIGNNVFIGANCTVLPGTIIHDNVIIGAGTVVKGVLNPNAVYGGIPCKVIHNGWYE
jgi:acetyltransferase-like isoleucine patch superfamily enzyme